MRAIYREQGNRLYKVRGTEVLEINLESYEYGIIGIVYADNPPLDMPNKYAKVIKKRAFRPFL